MISLAKLCSTVTVIGVAFIAAPQAQKQKKQTTPSIPVTADFAASPQPGVYGDGSGFYIDDLENVEATVAATCDTISLRTIAQNGSSTRSVVFDFTGYAIDGLGVESAAMYSYTKSQQNVCANDLRSLGVGESRIRYTYMQWQNGSGEYRVSWSDVEVTCTYRTTQCMAWRVVPVSSAEVAKVVGIKRGQYVFESKGFFQMPFELVLTAR